MEALRKETESSPGYSHGTFSGLKAESHKERKSLKCTRDSLVYPQTFSNMIREHKANQA